VVWVARVIESLSAEQVEPLQENNPKSAEASSSAAMVEPRYDVVPGNVVEVWLWLSLTIVIVPLAAISASPVPTTGLKFVPSPTNRAPMVLVVRNMSSPVMVRSPDIVVSPSASTLNFDEPLTATPRSV